MRLIKHLKDDQYPQKEITHTRNVVRALCYRDDYKVALIHVIRDDIDFGPSENYETPGGGVKKNETLIEALHREIKEELGATIDKIEPIGRIVDFYNQINRCNNNHYYLAHISSFGKQELEEYEKRWFSSIEYLDIEEAIDRYENGKYYPLATLVKNRELPILYIAKRRINRLKKTK